VRTYSEILEVAKPLLATWLATDPRVFAERVVTITDDLEAVRVFSDTLDQASAMMRRHGFELSDKLRDRMTASESPVVIVRADFAVGLETFRWAAVLGGTS
jgi:hypothetical protein